MRFTVYLNLLKWVGTERVMHVRPIYTGRTEEECLQVIRDIHAGIYRLALPQNASYSIAKED